MDNLYDGKVPSDNRTHTHPFSTIMDALKLENRIASYTLMTCPIHLSVTHSIDLYWYLGIHTDIYTNNCAARGPLRYRAKRENTTIN